MRQNRRVVTYVVPSPVFPLPLLLEIVGFEVLAHDGPDIDVLQHELTPVPEFPAHMQGVVGGERI